MEKLKLIYLDADFNSGNHISNVLGTDYNFKVHCQNTSLGILQAIDDFVPDIIILDVEIDGRKGIETAKKILRQQPNMPILFVSSLKQEEWIIRAIDAGGKAYIRKPFSAELLISYINRLVSKNQQNHLVSFANIQLNLHTCELYCKGKLVKRLSTLEKNAMAFFLQQPNQIISKELLMQKIWGGKNSSKGSISSLHNIISRLRELLRKNRCVKIVSIRGVGYQLRW